MSNNRSSYLVLWATVLLLATWLMLATLLVPRVIASAYRGESLPLLNDVLAGRDVHSLDKYLDDWRQVMRGVAVVTLATGLLFALLLHTEFHKFVDSRWPLPDQLLQPQKQMPRRRAALVHAIMVVIVGISACAIARPVELWPFSPYSMYAGVSRGRSVRDIRLFGLTAESLEIPLNRTEFTHPWDPGRLRDAVIILERENSQGQIADVLRNILAQYEERRRTGDHAGPELSGLRLYRMTWTLDPWASNRDRPDEKELIAEVQWNASSGMNRR